MRPGTSHQPTVDDFIDRIDHVANLTGSVDAIGIGTERPQYLRYFEQCRGTHVRAVSEAEEYQEGAPLHVLIGDGIPILIGELERSPDRRDLLGCE